MRIVSQVLEELVNTKSTPSAFEGGLAPTSKFHGLRAPTIAIQDYLLRISKFSGCSDECFVLALMCVLACLCARGRANARLSAQLH